MPSLDFEVYCNKCGSGLCGDTDVRGSEVRVQCDTCIEQAEKDGHDAGYDEGYDRGNADGYAEGYAQAQADAQQEMDRLKESSE